MVMNSYFCGLTSTEGGAIYDTSSGTTVIKRTGFYACKASSYGGAIKKRNGKFHFSNLCFEECAITAGSNNNFGYCAVVYYSNGMMSLCSMSKCGIEHMKYGDGTLVFINSAVSLRDLNSSWCFGFGSPGVDYAYNSVDSEEIHTVYSCGSGEMINELNYGTGSFERHNAVNCSAKTQKYLFYLANSVVKLVECCYFSNSYSNLLSGNSPTTINCLAYPPISGFGECHIGDIQAHFLRYVDSCYKLPSVIFTKSDYIKMSNFFFTLFLLNSVQIIMHKSS